MFPDTTGGGQGRRRKRSTGDDEDGSSSWRRRRSSEDDEDSPCPDLDLEVMTARILKRRGQAGGYTSPGVTLKVTRGQGSNQMLAESKGCPSLLVCYFCW